MVPSLVVMVVVIMMVRSKEEGVGDQHGVQPGYNYSEAHANPSHNSGEELGRIEVENCVGAVGREPADH